jgi:malonyl CoA-acyl carrier protein transacylase
VGPGAVLTGLLKRIERDVEVHALGTTEDLNGFGSA